MRILASFIAVLLVLAGLAVYLTLRAVSDVGVAAQARPPAQPATDSGLAVSSSPSSEPAPATSQADSESAGSPPANTVSAAASAPPVSAPKVRWAAPPTSAAERKLAAARAALRDAPQSEAARRDELAALVELGHWDEAERAVRVLRDASPDDPQLKYEHAAILLRLRRATDAIRLLEDVVAAEPDHARAWHNLAVARTWLGHLAAARAAWDRTIALGRTPGVEAHMQRGTVLLDLQEWAAAALDFEAVLALDPNVIDASHNLALAYGHTGRFDEARAVLAAAHQRHPNHILTLNRLAALTLRVSGLPDRNEAALRAEATRYVLRSLELNPNQPEMRNLLAQLSGRSP